MKHKIAVFASGNGSNFQAIIDNIKIGKIVADVELLVCDQPGAYVIERARAAAVPAFVISRKDFGSKQAFETAILEACAAHDVDFIFLAGYMRIIGRTLLSAYPHRIVNIHPSLLPSFQGLDAIGQAFEKGVKITGVTIHYIDEGVDTGPIIAQAAVPILETDDIEQLTARVHETEHRLYPETIAKLLENGERENCCGKTCLS